MNTMELEAILESNKHTRRQFRGVYASDELPTGVCAPSSLFVCNTAPHYDEGEHWIILFVDERRRGDFFDSFALHPTVKTFERFLNENSIAWCCNLTPVQHPTGDSCGHHCIFFSVYRCIGYSMNEIIAMYTDKLTLNDALVKKFVCDLT